MAIRRRIRLAIFAKDELEDLENDVIKFEELSERKQAASEKLSRAKKSRTAFRGPIFGSLEEFEGETLPSNITKRRTKTLTDRKADSEAANSVKASDRSSSAPIQRNHAFKEALSRIQELELQSDKFNKTVSDISATLNDPVRFIQNLVGKNSAAVARLFSTAGVITVITAVVVAKMQEIFGEGGPLDVRKLVRDEVKTIPELSFLQDVRTGRVFFTSDLRVQSGLVQNSVTQNLGEKANIYRELNIGSGLLG